MIQASYRISVAEFPGSHKRWCRVFVYETQQGPGIKIMPGAGAKGYRVLRWFKLLKIEKVFVPIDFKFIRRFGDRAFIRTVKVDGIMHEEII